METSENISGCQDWEGRGEQRQFRARETTQCDTLWCAHMILFIFFFVKTHRTDKQQE